MVDKDKVLLSAAEAAEIMKLTVGRIRQVLQSGELRGKRISGVWVIDRRDLEQFQKQRREL